MEERRKGIRHSALVFWEFVYCGLFVICNLGFVYLIGMFSVVLSTGFDIFSDTWKYVKIIDGESLQGSAKDFNLLNFWKAFIDNYILHSFCFTVSSFTIELVKYNSAGKSFGNIPEMNENLFFFHGKNIIRK